MNTTTTTTTATPEMMAVADEILEIYNRTLADRIQPGDQRIQQLIDHGCVAMGLPEEVLAKYYGDEEHTFERLVFSHLTALPVVPIEAPSWAARTVMMFDDMPDEINFSFEAEVSANGITVGVDSMTTLTIRDSYDPLGRFYPRGVLHADDQLRGSVQSGFEGFDFLVNDPAELGKLGGALMGLAQVLQEPRRELHRNTAPGEPELAGIGGGL